MHRYFAAGAIALAVVGAGARQPSTLLGPGEPGQEVPSSPEQSAPAPSVTQAFDQPVAGGLSPRNANYQIEVRLDHATHTLKGRETLRWRNITSRPTSELQFHLYWNAWRDNESTFMRERRLGSAREPRPNAWGSIEVTAIRLAGDTPADLTKDMKFIAPDDGNAADRTVMTVPLPAPVGPNEGVEMAIEWTSKVPIPFARTGYIDDYYFIVQWFPKVGVLEESGWNTHQFHAATEFYADFGVYDVRITVPATWVLGASGRMVATRNNSDNTTTHHYRGEDIHDFAWTTSPDFIEVRRTFEHPTLPKVEMRLLLQPEHRDQAERHFAATAACLKYYGEWFGPYPYGYVTIVDPAWQSGSGGMEYPTLFTAGSRWIAPHEVTQPEAVTVHEAGHQFWYGIVATNEFEHAWMDEGFNTFSTARTIEQVFEPKYHAQRYFDGFIPWVFRDIPITRATDGNRLSGYRDVAEADDQSTPTFEYWPGSASPITYNKTSLWLHTLERHLGWPTLQRILSTYFDRWKFRHPKPKDFFDVANEVSGQDLTWFFDQVHRSSNVFDYGVKEFRTERTPSGQHRSIVVAGRFGEAIFPVDVVTTFRNGEQVRERWDGRSRREMYVYERPVEAVSVQVDPGRVLLLDVNYTNNSRTRDARGNAASLKWALKWMVWMQDLMLTYGFFV